MRLGVDLVRDGRLIAWDFVASPSDSSWSTVESLTLDGAETVRLEWLPNRTTVRTFGNQFAVDGLAAPSIPGLSYTMETPDSVKQVLAVFLDQFRGSQLVHLKADSIRAANQLNPGVVVGTDGSQLAAVVANWTLEFPETLAEFTDIVRRCIPEMKRVFTRSSSAGHVKLMFEQVDGEQFEAHEVSDGVVLFAGLIAHALEAPPNALVLLEEPERGLHPRRLNELVDLLRTLVERRKTQFVMATHSPALLNVLRDEPEAILLFRRTPNGTEIRQLSEVPELAESLTRADPGELLSEGAFNEGFRGEEAAAG